jgi:hypothetical protein
MSVAGLRPFGLVALLAVGAACGSSAKPAAVTTESSTSTSTSSIAPTSSTTAASTTTAPAAGATTTSTSPVLANWTMPPPAADGSIAVTAFNARLVSDKPTWATDPQRVAHEFVRADNLDAASVDTQVTTNAPGVATVVVTANGLADDSIHAIRYELRLAQQADQTWRLTSAAWSQQCQPNRGHQTFGTALCI